MSQQCDTSTEVRHVRLRLSHSVCTASTRIDEHCPAALAEAEGIFQATLLLRILLHTVCSHSMQSQCAVTVCSARSLPAAPPHGSLAASASRWGKRSGRFVGCCNLHPFKAPYKSLPLIRSLGKRVRVGLGVAGGF